MTKSAATGSLTVLYNDQPACLRNAYEGPDVAVAEAYSLPTDLPKDILLAALLKLNLSRA